MSQPDLFGLSALTLATETGHVKAQQAAQKADTAVPGWTALALDIVAFWASRRAQGPFLLETARAYAEEQGLPAPPDKRAWGSIVQTLKKQGKIKMVGFGAAVSSNASPKCLWEWVR